MFLDLFATTELGGYLWNHEYRALSRAIRWRHAALPSLQDGMFDRDRGVAFVVTDAPVDTLDVSAIISYLQTDAPRTDMLRAFARLADALANLHGAGLLHRSISLETIEFSPSGESASRPLELRLTGFAMSSAIADIGAARASADAPLQDYAAIHESVRQLRKSMTTKWSTFCPPERLQDLFGTSHGEPSGDTEASDVYSLGVLGHCLFAAVNPAECELEAVTHGRFDKAEFDVLHGKLRSARNTAALPSALIAVLESMVRRDPEDRPRASGVVETLEAEEESIIRDWRSTVVTAPSVHLLGFMPEESRATLHKWGHLAHDPATEAGEAELEQLLRNDLLNGELTYSAEGFVPFDYRGAARTARPGEAKFVLLGRAWAWFAAPYFDAPWRGGAELPSMLLIKFVTDCSNLGDVFQASGSRVPLPPHVFTPVHMKARPDPKYIAAFPSWRPLRDEVERLCATIVTPRRRDWDQALRILLDFQDARLRARRYDYELVERKGTHRAVLRQDAESERSRLRELGWLYFLYARSQRQLLGDFCGSALEREDGGADNLVLWSHDSAERRNERGLKVTYLATVSPDHILVDHSEHRFIPTRGVLVPAGDRGDEAMLAQQRRTRDRLLQSRELLGQLDSPYGASRRWSIGASPDRGLHGTAPATIDDMLSCHPMFALWGPPGTGKTTVAAHAIQRRLVMDGSARILVSAQSHYALDNLAERVVEELARLKLEPICIRIARPGSEMQDRVGTKMKDHIPRRSADRIAESALSRTGSRLLGTGSQRQDLERLRADWRETLQRGDVLPELEHRLRRAANVVFATCASATARDLGVTDDVPAFDWVVIEEAAKAWPTELALPLLQGGAWTLIGDPFQLPAFRLEELLRFLEACETYSADESPSDPTAEREDLRIGEHARSLGRQREKLERVYRFFAHMFPRTNEVVDSNAAAQLDMQFRMRRQIQDLIFEAFYKKQSRVREIATHPDADRDRGIGHVPGFPAGALAWIDTDGMETCADQPCWFNKGEAAVAASVVRQLLDHCGQRAQVVVITPYNAQVGELKLALQGNAVGVHTVDSFQGREADVVVVSLVRDRPRGNSPVQNIGHLLYPERVNVMCSRARQLLVIVGKFAHFRATQCDFWTSICDSFSASHAVVPAPRVIGDSHRVTQ